MSEHTYFDEPNTGSEPMGDIDIAAQFKSETTSRAGAVWLRFAVSSTPFLVCMAVAWCMHALGWLIVGLILSGLLYSCIHVVFEWERAVVMRLGCFHRVAGPGFILMIPFVDSVTATVDMRMRSTAFKAEHVLTADLVPVNVDAVMFWMVWDAEKACVEVENYERLIYWIAQTTLRDVMGAVNIAQLSTRRRQMDEEVQGSLESKTNEWGITVTSVEIRDIEVPEELQESLSAEARAEQERNARMILAEVERDMSELFMDAATTYGKPDAALQLRAMSVVSESMKEHGGMMVVPSTLADAFKGLGSLGD